MEPYNKDIYGDILFSCTRSRLSILFVSLSYTFLTLSVIVYALIHNAWYSWVIAAIVSLVSLWQIDFIHRPVLLICEKGLLAAGPHRIQWRGLRQIFNTLYYPLRYSELRGISENWNLFFINGSADGELIELPVSLSLLSLKDKKRASYWISKMKKEEQNEL